MSTPPHALLTWTLVAQAVQAKREVKEACKLDLLGVSRSGWDHSVACENMSRFPDRPMLRQLAKVRVAWGVLGAADPYQRVRVCAQFDSLKRADHNFRAEQLDWQDKRVYVPATSKFEFNERHDGGTSRLSVPPALSRTEHPTHSALIAKVPSPALTLHVPRRPGGGRWRWLARRHSRPDLMRGARLARLARRLGGTLRRATAETPTLRRRRTRPRARPCCSLLRPTRRASRRSNARGWCVAHARR